MSKLLVLACILPLVLNGQPKVYTSSTPDWVDDPTYLNLKIDARQVSEGYYFKLYDYQIHAEQETYYSHVIREIVTEAGVQTGAEVWVNFAPSYQQVFFHEISVIRNGKKVSRLDMKKVKVIANEQEASSFIYNGNYAAYFILDDIRVGDQIEYSYSLKGDNPVFQDKFFEDIYLQLSVPVSQLHISVLVSEGRDVQIKTFNGADQPERSSNEDMVKMTWKDQQVAAPEFESYTPQWYDYYRHVQLSEYADWAEVANWAKSINPVPKTIQGGLLQKANQLLSESRGNKARYANKAIQFVQDDIRYTGIEIGAYSHMANHPEKVFKQRYGDCKDKSLLLVTLLKQAGIEAEIALLHTRLLTKVRDQLPSPGAFNHVIVHFVIDGQSYWVDPTISYQGGSLDDRSRPNRTLALLLKEPNDKLILVDYNQRGKIESAETYAISKTDSVSAVLDVETIYTGWQADKMRSQIAYNSVQGLESSYLDYYSKLYPGIEMTDSLRVLDDRTENRVVINEHYRIPEFLNKNEQTETLEVGFYAGVIAEQLPVVSGKRKTPIAVNYPTDIEHTVRVIYHLGWSVPKTTFFIDRPSYLFGSSAKSRGDTLLLNYRFFYHNPEVAANRSSEFAADITEFQNKYLSYAISISSVQIGEGAFTMAIIVCILILFAIFGLIGYWLYRIKVPARLDEETAICERIGGWLIFPLIWIFLCWNSSVFYLIIQKYHRVYIWKLMGDSTFYKALIFFELTLNVFVVCFAVLCIVTALKRRTIFPSLGIWFFLLYAGIQFVYFLWLYALIPGRDFSTTNGTELIISIVIASIFVPYMVRSERVKGTFTRP